MSLSEREGCWGDVLMDGDFEPIRAPQPPAFSRKGEPLARERAETVATNPRMVADLNELISATNPWLNYLEKSAVNASNLEPVRLAIFPSPDYRRRIGFLCRYSLPEGQGPRKRTPLRIYCLDLVDQMMGVNISLLDRAVLVCPARLHWQVEPPVCKRKTARQIVRELAALFRQSKGVTVRSQIGYREGKEGPWHWEDIEKPRSFANLLAFTRSKRFLEGDI